MDWEKWGNLFVEISGQKLVTIALLDYDLVYATMTFTVSISFHSHNSYSIYFSIRQLVLVQEVVCITVIM